MNSKYKQKYSEYVSAVEQYLDEFSSQGRYVKASSVLDAVRYSLLGGGKRIRPVLALAVGEMIGLSVQDVMPYAAAIEMVHSFSLIHDDLPDMDDDDLRRGKPSNHIVYGNATAILAGDALFAMAFESALSGPGDLNYGNAALFLAESSGLSGMAGGQGIDVEFASGSLDLDQLIEMHMLKTGALLEAAIVGPMHLSGESGELYEKLENYARYVGLAFQIRDDILDVEGDVAILGKETNRDSELAKNTFVSVLGLEESKRSLAEFTRNAVDIAESLGDKGWFLAEFARTSEKRNK